MKTTKKIEKFINDNKDIYAAAKAETINLREFIDVINVTKAQICSSEGKFTAYRFFDGESCQMESIEEVKLHLASKGFHLEKIGFNEYVFVNDEIKAAKQEAKAYNDRIIECRDILHQNAMEFLFRNYDKRYVRFGDIPECGRSYNFRDNFFEKGISAYSAVKVGANYYVDVVGSFAYLTYHDTKKAYEISGTELDTTGSDGEPLLTSAAIVRKISNDKVGRVDDFVSDIFSI